MAETLDTLAAKIDSLTIIVRDGFQNSDARFEQVDQRFEQVDKRFEQVDQRFEQADKRFEQVDKRFEQVDKRFEQVDKRFEQVDKRIKQVDKRIKQVDKRFEQVDKRFEQADKRVEQVGRRFEQKIDGVRSELRTLIESVDAKVGLVLEKVVDLIERDDANVAAHRRFEQRLENHDLRLLALESLRRGPPDSERQ